MKELQAFDNDRRRPPLCHSQSDELIGIQPDQRSHLPEMTLDKVAREQAAHFFQAELGTKRERSRADPLTNCGLTKHILKSIFNGYIHAKDRGTFN